MELPQRGNSNDYPKYMLLCEKLIKIYKIDGTSDILARAMAADSYCYHLCHRNRHNGRRLQFTERADQKIKSTTNW